MNLLAVETSSIACSVALQVDEKRIERHVVEAKAHTRILLPMINELLAEAGLSVANLDALVLGNGPGSFIGMRIGASVVQGLAFAAGLNIIPVSSLAAVAAEVFSLHDADRVAVAQDARMNEVYLGCYERSDLGLPVNCTDECLHPMASIDALAGSGLPWSGLPWSGLPWAAAGGGWQRYPELLNLNEEFLSMGSEVTLPRASALFGLAETLLSDGQDIAPQELQPAYLRSQVAVPPAKR